MKINILADMQVHDLKSQFHELFPYLKIEFFDQPHKVSSGSSKSSMHENTKNLSDLMKNKDGGLVEVNALTSVKSFEQLLDESFGLHVQVFRKSGELYIETTKTDDWTLGQQNEEGKMSGTIAQHEEPKDMTDRDQWE